MNQVAREELKYVKEIREVKDIKKLRRCYPVESGSQSTQQRMNRLYFLWEELLINPI